LASRASPPAVIHELLAHSCFRTDDAFRAASHFTEVAKASTAGRRLPAHAAAYGYNSTIFEWMSTPEQAWRGQRVGRAMVQSHTFANKHIAEGAPDNHASPAVR
jgi:hypothetical protein